MSQDQLEILVLVAELLRTREIDSQSEMQLNDIKNLIASTTDLHWAYLDKWAPILLVSESLESPVSEIRCMTRASLSHLPEQEVRIQLFKRFYGSEFDEKTSEKIIA